MIFRYVIVELPIYLSMMMHYKPQIFKEFREIN